MKALGDGSVVAFRPIGDEADGIEFRLAVVVQTWQMASEDIDVLDTDVTNNTPYMIVSWFEVDSELDDGNHVNYVLGNLKTCVSGERIGDILPVKKLRKVTLPKGKKKNRVLYSLHGDSLSQIRAIV